MVSDSSTPTWPATRYEELPWKVEVDRDASHRSQLRARGPYEAAIPPFIANLDIPPLDRDTLVAAEDAVIQLSRFDAEVGSIAAPFSAILLRSESASSSEIERLTAAPKGIAMAELGKKSGPNARLVVANVHAMEAAIAMAGDLDANTIIAMQRVLLEDTQPELTGTWRDQPVWIGGTGNTPHSAAFVPPHHGRVPALMADLVEFARRVDLPVLPQIAIAHAQFETIHPFADGNGRTGRALVHSMLHRLGITRNVTVPVSAGLLRDTSGYFAALTAYREGQVAPIIRSFALASAAALSNGRKLVDDLTYARASWGKNTSARAGSAGYRMLDLLQRQPVVDANLVAHELAVTPQNAQNAIDRLVADGILYQIGENQRGRAYEARDVLTFLDDFARRSKRPRGS